MIINRVFFTKQRNLRYYPAIPMEFQNDSACILILIKQFAVDQKKAK
jgi:hypothetical protein